MSKSEIIRFMVLRSLGNFLLLFSIFGIFATFGPSLYYEAQFRIMQISGFNFQVATESQIHSTPLGELLKKEQAQNFSLTNGFGAILNGKKQQILIPKDPEFSILIPKIGAENKIIPNVDPTNEKEFLPILYKGVAHAKGSVFPGMPGNIYLFAHSTDNFWDVGRYNAVFYLLKDLVPGDQIVIFFENRRHDYAVTDSKIVDPSDVSYLVNSQNQKTEQLILQTCWPPGTTWKRLLVFAKPK